MKYIIKVCEYYSPERLDVTKQFKYLKNSLKVNKILIKVANNRIFDIAIVYND